jgi:S-DNA-T family DNA segregation ATPase FtsK/SpoIIIE
LLALALYGDAAGFAGRGVDQGLGSLIGWIRFLVPPVCFVAGLWIISGRARPELIRTSIGSGLGVLAMCGLAELAGGSPKLNASSSALRGAGGWVGVLTGRSIQLGVGSAGAAVILTAVTFVALIITTRTSLGTLGGAGSWLWRRLGEKWGSLHRATTDQMASAGEEEDEAPVTPSPWTPIEVPVAEEPPLDEEPEEELAQSEESEPVEAPVAPLPQKKQSVSTKGESVEWQLPPMTLLKRSVEQRHDERQLDAAGESLVSALAAHGVETRLAGRTVGPTVTRFEIEIGPGVKVARVTSLSKDIAYAMASPDVRILAPIPGRSAIGVEVPNRQRQLVALRDVLESKEAHEALHPLEVAFGRDIAGRAVMANLADMPHILISGATGAGKSSCINSIVTSVLMRATPEEVRLILVDPKRVELGNYNGLPHLITPVVVDPKKAANALAWAVKEMERRYDLLAEYGMRDITGYNEAHDRGELGPLGGPSVHRQVAEVAARAKARAHGSEGHPEILDEAEEDIEDNDEQMPERLPFILVVVDELNDLMMVAARDVEDSVCRIAQMARAVGIHLVLATQRPSVDVITGVIKANIPSRMAFSVSSLADSRVILDQPGAERLIGKGDMLVLTASSSNPRRLQGPWVSEAEVHSVVAHWRRQGRTTEPIVGIELAADSGPAVNGNDDDDDEFLQAALELVVRSQLGSTSMLQRKLRVGFARAGRLMDLLERRGVVGPSEGSKARAVLMTPEELDGRPA